MHHHFCGARLVWDGRNDAAGRGGRGSTMTYQVNTNHKTPSMDLVKASIFERFIPETNITSSYNSQEAKPSRIIPLISINSYNM